MPLSEKTIEEMRAGAASLAKFAGANGIDPAYMEAMIRTQQRAKWLKDLAKEGRIRIENQTRVHTNAKEDKQFSTATVVWIGDNSFRDEGAELTGAWPSEVLVANVALALGAGEDVKARARDNDSLQGPTSKGIAHYNYMGDRISYDPAVRLYKTRSGKSWTPQEFGAELSRHSILLKVR